MVTCGCFLRLVLHLVYLHFLENRTSVSFVIVISLLCDQSSELIGYCIAGYCITGIDMSFDMFACSVYTCFHY